MILNDRIPEEKESVLLDNYEAMYQYANLIIKGRFSDKLEKLIMLKSFSDKNSQNSKNKFLVAYLNKDPGFVNEYFLKYRR